MDTVTYNAIVDGTPGLSIQVAAADLRAIVAGMVQGEQAKITKALEAHREKPTMSRAEVARALGVTTATLWRWAKDGYLTPVKIGSKVLYRASDIEQMLNRQKQA